MPETTRWLTLNELVAYNLARARRAKGWTQDETAERLRAATGRSWTSATLGAAERSWQTQRVREFNADELMAFCKVFDQPFLYFFLPVDPDDGEYEYTSQRIPRKVGKHLAPTEKFTPLDLIAEILAWRSDPEFKERVELILRKVDLDWSPGRVTWYRPEEHWTGGTPEEEAEADAASRQAAARDPLEKALRNEARTREAVRRLHELINFINDEEPPPF